MKKDGLTPFAFGDKDGWPAMGTFDILNMRINGYDFHVSLMAGEEAWDGDEVKQVFEHLGEPAALPPGATRWAAPGRRPRQSLGKEKSGMYLLGTFVVDAVPEGADRDDLDFFTFPELDSSIGADALDAPIDGFCMASAGKNEDGGKELLECLGTRRGRRRGQQRRDAPFIAANDGREHHGYTALQKKSAEVVGAAANIAQFLDRDTRPTSRRR